MATSATVLFPLLLLGLVGMGVAIAYPSLDGSTNHPAGLGTAGSPFSRPSGLPIQYADGYSAVYDPGLSAREISTATVRTNNLCNSKGLSELLTYWGQLVVHDITGTVNLNRSEPLFIAVPITDELMDPFGTGTQKIPFFRSSVQPNTGIPGVPRQQLNGQTPFVDASVVYGVDPTRLQLLRSGVDGKLKEGTNRFLPRAGDAGIPMENNARRVPTEDLFAAGDERANSNPGLTSMHTLLMREHNRQCDRIKALNPPANSSAWTDETLFEEARRWVIAEMQSITFNEYLPALLGGPLQPYTGYNSSLDPQLSNLFSSAIFRYGHSEVSSTLLRLNEDRTSVPAGAVLLRDCFYDSNCLLAELENTGGLDALLRGLAGQCQQAVDLNIVDDLHNFLFGIPGAGGLDLFALNLQRTRDHGAALYNDARKFYSLPEFSSFDQITSNPLIAERLAVAYRNNISAVETYVGGLAEDLYPKAGVGELFWTAIQYEYTRMRNSDRFFYLNDAMGFTAKEQEQISSFKISDLILLNTNISTMQCAGFYLSNTRDCSSNFSALASSSPSARGVVEALNGDVRIQWRLGSDSVNFDVQANTVGWVAIGFAQRSVRMLGTDAIVIWVDGNGTAHAQDSYITDRNAGCPGVCPDEQLGGRSDVTHLIGSLVNGSVRASFTRSLRTADAGSTDIALDPHTVTHLVFAMSVDGSTELKYHGAQKGGVDIYLAEGRTAQDYSIRRHRIAHGTLMFLAFGVLFPIGAAFPRFFKQFWKLWFVAHLVCQYGGLAVVFAGFMAILQSVSFRGGSHFRNPHAILGFVVFLLSIVPPVLGQMSALLWRKDVMQVSIFPTHLHKASGYLVITLSWATLYVGLHRFGAPILWYILLACWMILLLSAAAVFSLPFMRERMVVKILNP